MIYLESFNFLRLTFDDGYIHELSVDRDISGFFRKVDIYIPTKKRWAELYPNYIYKREEVLQAAQEFAKKKSGIFYKYHVEEYD